MEVTMAGKLTITSPLQNDLRLYIKSAIKLLSVWDKLSEIPIPEMGRESGYILLTLNEAISFKVWPRQGICSNLYSSFLIRSILDKIKCDWILKENNGHSIIYPVGGFDEYHSNTNLYKNPKRKEFLLFTLAELEKKYGSSIL